LKQAADKIEEIEKALGRKAVIGHRKKPDGSELEWKQLGVLETLEDSQKPFFIQWLTEFHPSKDGSAVSEISNIEISGDHNHLAMFIKDELNLGKIKLEWVNPNSHEMSTGIMKVVFNYRDSLITIR
jgi:hypothetical protein